MREELGRRRFSDMIALSSRMKSMENQSTIVDTMTEGLKPFQLPGNWVDGFIMSFVASGHEGIDEYFWQQGF